MENNFASRKENKFGIHNPSKTDGNIDFSKTVVEFPMEAFLLLKLRPWMSRDRKQNFY